MAQKRQAAAWFTEMCHCNPKSEVGAVHLCTELFAVVVLQVDCFDAMMQHSSRPGYCQGQNCRKVASPRSLARGRSWT